MLVLREYYIRDLMNVAIELNALSKIYKRSNGTSFKAVDELTLSIPTGQIIGFLGPNGAGKTTTIKMICDIISPTQGSVKINGFSVKEQRAQALAHVGAVLEGTRNIYWQLTPLQNLTYFGRLKGLRSKELKSNAEMLIQALDLEDKKNQQVSGLSRGTQQKVAVACALITNPSIVILDEPTLGLDVKASRQIKQWIFDLAHKQKKTVLLTTHQLDIAEQLCERIVIINKGKIIADQPTQELLKVFHEEHYQIAIAGKVDESLHILPGMKAIEKDDHTLFVGAIASQEELYQKLTMIHSLKLPLLSVTRTKQNLEEVFMQLTQRTDAQRTEGTL